MTSGTTKNTAKDIADRAGTTVDEAEQAATGTASRFAESAHDLKSEASDVYGQTRERASDAAASLSDRASDAVDRSRETYKATSRKVAGQVIRQPIEALLLAGAIGYLVGWAANRN